MKEDDDHFVTQMFSVLFPLRSGAHVRMTASILFTEGALPVPSARQWPPALNFCFKIVVSPGLQGREGAKRTNFQMKMKRHTLQDPSVFLED